MCEIYEPFFLQIVQVDALCLWKYFNWINIQGLALLARECQASPSILEPMPLINVHTSLPALKDGSALLQELSSELANQTGKPEAYVMTLLETGVPMTFAGSHEPCAYVEVKSIGALRPPAMTAAFCELIQARTGIPANRVYIGFEDVQASCWGWNGNTFG